MLKVWSPASWAARSPTSPGSSARSSPSSAHPSRSRVDGGKGRLTIGDVADADLDPVRRRDRQDDRPVGDRVLDDPRLPGLRGQVRATSSATGSGTGCPTSTGTATTPSRATSASRPERGRRAMFAVGHLRDPRRDRAILGGSLVALSALAWLSLWAWSASPYAPYLHHEGGVAPHPGRGAPVLPRLGPDDRRDDAAVERAAGRHVRGHRRPAAPTAAAGRPPARRLPRRLGRLRPRGLGPRPRHPRRRRRAFPGWRRIRS